MTGAPRTTTATRWCRAGRVNAVCVITTLTIACQAAATRTPASVLSVCITRRGTDARDVDRGTSVTPPRSPAQVSKTWSVELVGVI